MFLLMSLLSKSVNVHVNQHLFPQRAVLRRYHRIGSTINPFLASLLSSSLSLFSRIDSHLIFETNFNFLVPFYSLYQSLYIYPISLPYLCLMKWNKTFTRKSFVTLNCPLRFSISDRYIYTHKTQSYTHTLTQTHTHTHTRDTHTLKKTAFNY